MARYTNVGDLKTFQQNVESSGTPVQLTSYPVPDGVAIVVKAKSTNSGNITVGGSSADALNTGTAHFILDANESLELELTNTNKIWIDSTADGEGVEVMFEF